MQPSPLAYGAKYRDVTWYVFYRARSMGKRGRLMEDRPEHLDQLIPKSHDDKWKETFLDKVGRDGMTARAATKVG